MKRIFNLLNKNVFNFSSFIRPFVKKIDVQKELPIITISREAGSGGRPIAFEVAKKLGNPWMLYHKEIVEEIAKQTRLEQKLIREIDEQNIPLVEEIVGNFFGKRYPTLSNYYKHLVRILSVIGHRGNAIIMGRGAHFLFPHSLKVRIICEMEQRIKWIMEYEGAKTAATALKRIEESDNQRIEFNKKLFHHDIRKAHHYDLVIRTGKHLTVDDAADIIVYTAKKRFKL